MHLRGQNPHITVAGWSYRYHGSAILNDKGEFCLPIPVNNNRRRFNKNCNCSAIRINGYVKLLQDLKEAMIETSDMSCWSAYTAFQKALLNYAETYADFLINIADNFDYNIDDNTRKALREQASRFYNAIFNDDYATALNILDKIGLYYGEAKKQLTAEDYSKLVKEAESKMLSREFGKSLTILGLDIIPNGAGEKLKLGDFLGKLAGII